MSNFRGHSWSVDGSEKTQEFLKGGNKKATYTIHKSENALQLHYVYHL